MHIVQWCERLGKFSFRFLSEFTFRNVQLSKTFKYVKANVAYGEENLLSVMQRLLLDVFCNFGDTLWGMKGEYQG